jgi:hypothetical protein
VLLGILIALQLNEWRNDVLDIQQKQEVLIALKSDFESNLKSLNKVFDNHEKSFKIFTKTKTIIDSIVCITDINVFKASLAHGGYGSSYNPVNRALRSAVSSADIHLIENERLVVLLFSCEDLVLDSHDEIDNIQN